MPRPLFEQIDSWLQEIDNTKTAAAKQANPAGMGKTTHPSEKVDNFTQEASEGERSRENTADIKADITAGNVDSTDPKGGGTQDDKQYNIGTTQSATGEDPSTEDNFKGTKEDSKTTHPADAEDVGNKYGSMKIEDLLKLSTDKANLILAEIANGASNPPVQAVVTKAAAPTQSTQPAAVTQPNPTIPADTTDTTKLAEEFLVATMNDADKDADLVGAFLHSYWNTRVKQAEGEAAEGESHEPPPAEGPPEGGPEGGGGDVLSALGAGGGGGGEVPPVPPPGGGGEAPPGAGPGGPGGGEGGMSQEQALQELVMALEELGINPQELAQLAQQAPGGAGGGGAAGMPPGGPGGGMPPDAGGGLPPGGPGGGMPPPPPGAAEGAKLAKAAHDFKRSGKFRFSEAKTAAQYHAREQIKDYIREITGLKS